VSLYKKEILMLYDGVVKLQVFDWMHGVAGYKPDVTIYQTMIILLGKAQRMDVAESLFEGMVKEGLEPGQNEYTSLIAGYIRSGSLQRGIAMLERMKEVGMRPSVSTYNTLIDGCTRAAVGKLLSLDLFYRLGESTIC
jgi:pentatricopeptide repeat protein